MHRALSISILAGLLAITSVPGAYAHKKPDIAIRQQLDSAAQEMYRNADQDFIIVKAVGDGIIRTGRDCYFKYEKGIVYFNRKKLKGSLQEQYSNYMKDFLKAQETPVDCLLYISIDPFSLNDLLDPGSAFHHKLPVCSRRPGRPRKN